uniref:F-box domain-containing protein n=1 Tax=Steinernema glaseri TaxID=37863 RepID=A0A1I7YGW9_9BILA
MNSVPQIFVESVCLCLDRRSIRESCKILSWWGQVFSAFSKKIHTLYVFVDKQEGRLYAAAETILRDLVPLDSVDPKFITNFRTLQYREGYSNDWKEITLNQLQRLVRFIKPTTEGRPPVCYALESCNEIYFTSFHSTGIGRKLLSMRLPVNSVFLWPSLEEDQAAAEEFLENTGPLYHITIRYTHSALKQSTVDALIDKFVPVDGGSFRVTEYTNFTRDQLEKLVLKCEMSDKKVKIEVCPEGFTETSKVTDFFDFDKHYSKKKVEKKGITASRDGAQLLLRVRRYDDALIWKWDSP